MDLGVAVPVAAAICAYICLMEITSIIENACKINPNLILEKLAAMFGGLKDKDAGSITAAEDKGEENDAEA